MNIRNSLINRLSQDLIGPDNPASEEFLLAYPSDVYLTGILFPQNSKIAQEDMDQLQSEGATDLDSNDVSKDEISLANLKRPSSMGLSFVVESSEKYPNISIEVNAGAYRQASQQEQKQGNSENKSKSDKNSENMKGWVRQPVKCVIDDLILDFKTKDIGTSQTNIEGLNIHIKTSNWKEKLLVTVALINANVPGDEYERGVYEEMCFFQTLIKVTPGKNSRLCPRPVHGMAIDEDTNTASLIYRNVVDYATGHTCSASWPEPEANGRMPFVETDWLPRTLVKAMSSAGIKEFETLIGSTPGPVLSTKWLSETSGKDLVQGLQKLPVIYSNWLKQQASRTDYPSQMKDQADRHINQANLICGRINQSIDLIASDKNIEYAFRLANRAIQIQRRWMKPNENDLVWRPFQLGFILLSLGSIADENNEDRDTADLLWFPTGGGKTEAYLGLIAFTLFLRRLRYGEKGAGVSTIMRYTMRLLTIQQFQRAAALICACEAIRLGDNKPDDIKFNFFGTPFSMGLWVGRDATPNTFEEAVKALKEENSPSRPDQIKYCPKHTKAKLFWIPDYERKRIYATCPEKGCKWSSAAEPLPVWTVDEDIYRVHPSLIIGTVDKFAQIARKPQTTSLFGLDSDFRQPDLIIQDELHLISGPLGTLAGLYEAAIDRLCSHNGIKPKIIASTATIRQAATQIKALFNRRTCLFPPPIIDATNSGFAVEDDKDPGRLFIGITTAGRSAKFTLQAATASLMQAIAAINVDPKIKDDFWTAVAYFNSLRELGGALVLMQDDVLQSIQQYALRRPNETARVIKEPVELTSRVSSSEIKNMLENLTIPCDNPESCDVLLASNMMSVGVDISRLGLMIVNGQPKSIAEYIQATSRVGRRFGGPGGLIITIYNNGKSRDRSHYETFQTWHRALYREVEATSVTPFASRAREKAIHAVLTILVRHLIPDLRIKARDVGQYVPKIQDLADYIHSRVQNIDEEEMDETDGLLEDYIEKWVSNASALRCYWSDRAPNSSLLISAEKAAEITARKGCYSFRAKPTPNSLRNVEPSSLFSLKEKLGDQI